jgi:hypothetical protein
MTTLIASLTPILAKQVAAVADTLGISHSELAADAVRVYCREFLRAEKRTNERTNERKARAVAGVRPIVLNPFEWERLMTLPETRWGLHEGQRVRYTPGIGTYGYEDVLENDGAVSGVVIGFTRTRVRFRILTQGRLLNSVRSVNALSLHVEEPHAREA